MAGIQFTENQQKVIDSPVCDLLVSAAAGSGKTAVLVERIMNHICDRVNPIDIDRILIVTFTRNAAASMKERIHRALEKKCEEEPENRFFTAQLQKLSYADITTIDGFCLKILKNYFYAADIEPNFRVADANEADLLLYDAVLEVLEHEYERADADFLDFMGRYGNSKGDGAIVELLKNIVKKSQSHPWPKDYIYGLSQLYVSDGKESFDSSFLAGEILDSAKIIIEDCINTLDAAYSYVSSDASLAKYSDMLDSDREFYAGLLKAQTFSSFRKLYDGHKFITAPRKPKDADERLAETVKALRDKAKKACQEFAKDFFSEDESKTVENNRQVLPCINALISLSEKVFDLFNEVKKSKSLMEFSDVNHAVLDILVKRKEDGTVVPTVYAEELKKKYDEIMIDEYQDSNYIQEVILSSISGRSDGAPNVFMVGDVKQCIYKFRMAMPELFMQKYSSFGRGNDRSLVIDLSQNFRSAGCVVDTVNEVFRRIMTERTCGINYDENASLNQEKHYGEYENSKDAVSEFNLIDLENAAESDKSVFTASAIAERIKRLMKSDIKIAGDGSFDRIRFSDIVILVRSMTGSAAELINRLPDEGIPVCVETSSGYFKTTEISLVLNYLRIVDNPYQDIEFASVLRSFCVGLTDEELALIKIYDKKNSGNPSYLFDAALAYFDSSDADTECASKLARFFEVYEQIKQMSVYSGIYEVILAIYEKTGYYSYVQILPSGEMRKANLDLLLVKARKYEAADFTGINSFLRYIDKLVKYDMDTGEANTALATDAVRVMSIHKSKGLEFPVVILADTEKNYNIMDERESFILHGEKGIGLRLVNPENNSYKNSLQRKYLASLIHRESIAEEIRILYVALTRAKQKMIIFSSSSDTEASMKKWLTEIEIFGNKISYSYIEKAKCSADLLAPVFLQATGACNEAEALCDGEPRVKGRMSFSLTDGDRLLKNISEKLISTQEKIMPLGDGNMLSKRLKDYFGFEYQGEEENIPVKYSVSELKHQAMEEYEAALENSSLIAHKEEAEEKIPAFVNGQKAEPFVNGGAVLGTLTHMLMEKIVFEKKTSYGEIKDYVEGKIADKSFPEEMRKVSIKKVSAFLNSDLGKRIQAADERGELYVEQPFVLGIPACEANESFNSSELVLIQGVIDVFFIEDGEAVLLDYKTDRVPTEGGEEILRGRYRRQLDLYAEAIEKIKKISVKSKIIYSFSMEKELYL